MELANRLPPPWVIEDENERKKDKKQDEGARLPTPSEPETEHHPEQSEESNKHQVVILDI